MKICLINNFYQPQVRGGAEKVIARMIQALKADYEICLITLAQVGEKDSFALEDGVGVYRLASSNVYHLWQAGQFGGLRKIYWHLKNVNNQTIVKKVLAILAAVRPAVIMTGNLTGLSLSLPHFLHQQGYPVIHYLFDYQLIDPQGTLFRKNKYLNQLPWYLNWYKNWVAKYFTKVNYCVGPSQFIINKYQEHGFFKNILVGKLPTPVVAQALPAIRLSQISLPLKLIYVGQIEPSKGVDWLLKTLINYSKSDWQLTVVGDGSIRQTLIDQYQNDPRIIFVGKKMDQELLTIWQQQHLTIIPSLWWENFTTVAIESYQLGLPVIGSSSGGTPELIAQGQSGLVFQAGNQQDFYQKLDAIFNNLNILETWSAYLAEHLEQYSEQRFIQKFNQIVALILKR
ncbi:MAG: glycosyltransferase [Candidatus Komeilibacteria bacterium]|nr:glycosyltransferase [Candidatus Komeilibacteria bacterium]